MPDDPILADMVQEAGEHIAFLIRKAFEAGRKAGRDEARARVLAAFGDAPAEPLPLSTRAPHATTARADSLPAGAVIARPVRAAMCSMLMRGGEGASPRAVTLYMQRRRDMPTFTERQVRAALKSLLKRGDLEKVARGRFQPSARLRAEFAEATTEPEATTSNNERDAETTESEGQPAFLSLARPNGEMHESY